LIQRILTAAILIPLVLLLILRAPVWLLAIVAGAVALLAIREFLELTAGYGVEPFTVGTYVFVGIFYAALAAGEVWFPLHKAALLTMETCFLAALAPFLFLSGGLRRNQLASVYSAAAASVFAFAYIAIPMGMLVDIQQQCAGSFHLIFLMFVVWSGDILAYFVGRSLGRYKMAPRVSPKKTWEGAVASLVASVLFGTMTYHYSGAISWGLFHAHLSNIPLLVGNGTKPAMWKLVLICAILNVAAQLGDLVESAIKRGANVKDSGAILPGHGGILDRIDALLFAAPVMWFCSLWWMWECF
jgi:phosphatidate cytidylyltransferase